MLPSLHDVDYQALRALMRSLRVKAKLTQVQMAEKLGIGQSYVSKLERGENFFDVLLFARWCQICNERPGQQLDEFLTIWRGTFAIPKY